MSSSSEGSFPGLPLVDGYGDEVLISSFGPTFIPLGGGRVIRYDPFTRTSSILYGMDMYHQDYDDGWDQGRKPASRKAVEGLTRVAVGNYDEPCVICLEDWLSLEEVAAEMPCKHKFHYECVEKWLGIHATCPVCRYNMPLEGEEELVNKVQEISINEVAETRGYVVDDGEDSIDYFEYYNYTDDDCDYDSEPDGR